MQKFLALVQLGFAIFFLGACAYYGLAQYSQMIAANQANVVIENDTTWRDMGRLPDDMCYVNFMPVIFSTTVQHGYVTLTYLSTDGDVVTLTTALSAEPSISYRWSSRGSCP
jgi:hypothetical protein